MEFLLPITIPALTPRIKHTDKILLIGSCFTEHIYHFLQQHHFEVEQNSHGILFNPMSVCKALNDIVENKKYTENDLFQLNEYWHSWFHHSDFSFLDKQKSLQKINETIQTQHEFIKNTNYIFITLGSAFAYKLIEKNIYVSNNHRAPQQWFEKTLLPIDTIITELQQTQEKIKTINPHVQFVYTISPVRHSRDGVIENNRSKARLLEAVHSLNDSYYFPAYELVIDVLRDYRFYDIDMVHPNYQATQFVWNQFKTHCIDEHCFDLLKQLHQIYKAKNHLPKDTNSQAHQQFLKEHLQLCEQLKQSFPYLNLTDEINYFNKN